MRTEAERFLTRHHPLPRWRDASDPPPLAGGIEAFGVTHNGVRHYAAFVCHESEFGRSWVAFSYVIERGKIAELTRLERVPAPEPEDIAMLVRRLLIANKEAA